MSEPEHAGSGQGPEAEQDAVWREIVANFGERADLTDDDTGGGADVGPGPEARDLTPSVVDVPLAHRVPDRPAPPDHEEHFVPPEPPPLPRPTGARLAAWAGLFGVPVLVIVLLVLDLSVPGWVVFLLFVGFLSGFGYLIATMRKHDDADPWDDGAVV